MTNREAWQEGYKAAIKGLHPRPDYPLVGLAGSYREGYEAGLKRRKEPKGPKQNPGFLSHALAKHRVKQARQRLQAEIARVRNRIAELEQEVIEYRHGPIWKGDARAKQWAAQASLKVQKLRAVEKKLVRGLEELPVINPRRNGIVEAAAGLQALDYLGSKAKKARVGEKPKYNPKEDRFLLQIVTASGKREQFTNTEKQAREIAASWYSRGASVTVIDRKKKTQTVYGKKNPRREWENNDEVRLKYKIGKLKAGEVGIVINVFRGGSGRGSDVRLHVRGVNGSEWVGPGDVVRINPRAKGSRDALGVFHAENPSFLLARAFNDWLTRRAYIDNNGNYRVRREGLSNGPIASWNKEIKRSFKTVTEFHRAAESYQQQRRRNPSIADLSRTFQGEADGSVEQMHAAQSAPANLARAGKLVFLKAGNRTFRIPGAMVAIAPNEKLWIVGDHAPLFETKAKSGQGLDIGEITHICYETAKAHIGNGKTFEYIHEFGEDGGKRPRLIIDSEGMPILRGGDYKIRAEGIVN